LSAELLINMWHRAQHILVAAIIVALTFPDWRPEFGVSVDGSCAWLYNYLFAGQPALLAHLIFPHGPLDFLQTPLPIGKNLEIALIANTLLRFFFVWSGLKLSSSLPGSLRLSKWRYWLYTALMMLWLQVNMMDVLLAATVGHLLLLALSTGRQIWLAPAVFLAATGLLVKTIIGMPAVMMYGITCWILLGKTRQWKQLAGWWGLVPAIMLGWWLFLFGSFQGFVTMALSTVYLTLGNSAAVCHYPSNSWWLLGGFWGLILLWPLVVKETRNIWWVMLLPIFAFWKYGISREDIWHIHATYRFYGWVLGVLLLHLTTLRARPFLIAFLAMGCFGFNLRNSEGWSPYEFRNWGLPHFYAWTVHFGEKKAAAQENCRKNMDAIVMPDSIRGIVGDRTIDIFPWHYAFAAANNLHLQPRHIPQSYAAYHPWLDAQDASFFKSDAAPDFLLFHLKPYSEGGQFMGLDDRFLLNDAPETLLAILDRYQVKVRHPRYLLLEKTTAHFIGEKKLWPFSTDWQQQLPVSPGIVRLKAHIEKTVLGRLKSFLYKDDPVFLDIRTGSITRRIKIVPALAESGIWLAPWMEEPSVHSEPYRIPDAIQFVFPNGNSWQLDANSLQLEWIAVNAASPFLPEFRPVVSFDTLRTVFEQQAITTAPPDGYSPGWEQVFESSPGEQLAFEAAVEIQSPKDNSCANLVIAVTDAQGQTAHYASTEYCGMGVGEKGWPTGLRTVLPAGIAAPYRVKIYVWNTGKKEIKIKKMTVFVKKLATKD
jgi:hypothetical protein